MARNTKNDAILIHKKYDVKLGIGVNFNQNILTALPHWHEFFEAELIVGGNGAVVINGVSHEIRPGLLYCLSPHDLHEIISDGTVTLYNVVFDERFFDSFPAAEALAHAGRWTYVEPDSAEMERLIGVITLMRSEITGSDAQTNVALNTLLKYYLLLLLRLLSDGEPQTGENCPDLIRSVVAYINRNYCSELLLRDVAARFFVNEHYLSSLFSRKVGVKYCEYLSSLRLANARNLLCSTSMSIGDVARQSGFGSYSNFTRAFGKKYGMTPGELRARATAKVVKDTDGDIAKG